MRRILGHLQSFMCAVAGGRMPMARAHQRTGRWLPKAPSFATRPIPTSVAHSKSSNLPTRLSPPAISSPTPSAITTSSCLGIARSSSSNCWISPLLPSASANHLHRFANQVPVPMIRKGTVTRGPSPCVTHLCVTRG